MCRAMSSSPQTYFRNLFNKSSASCALLASLQCHYNWKIIIDPLQQSCCLQSPTMWSLQNWCGGRRGKHSATHPHLQQIHTDWHLTSAVHAAALCHLWPGIQTHLQQPPCLNLLIYEISCWDVFVNFTSCALKLFLLKIEPARNSITVILIWGI